MIKLLSGKVIRLPGDLHTLNVSFSHILRRKISQRDLLTLEIHYKEKDTGLFPRDCSDRKAFDYKYNCNLFWKMKLENKDRQYYLLIPKDIENKWNPSQRKSWNKASVLCKHLEGYLPLLHTTQKLKELLNIFHVSKHTSAIEAIYIGLIYNFNVSIKYIRYLFVCL